ncbi:MAG: hypothetical protein A2X49_11480 [Lentisphaerae bacterium GWF2_52_8]|nr:MAG: hypothetical protein A2X49_11480 [Lentisphaerae bacterium GWF2_52_8]
MDNKQAAQEQMTVIMDGTVIEGKISGTADVMVQGLVSGEVELQGLFTIAPEGKSTAEIKADNVVVEGQQTGNVLAKECIQIMPSGRVRAELKAPEIAIERGAKFSGQIDMAF